MLQILSSIQNVDCCSLWTGKQKNNGRSNAILGSGRKKDIGGN
jgi:hypothetical protein